MPFISVVPAVRTPFGVDVFDYRIPETNEIAIGDLIRLPFRRRLTSALVVRRSDESAFAGKTVSVDPFPILRLGSASVELLARTAQHTFSSQPTVLASWIRHIPVRAGISAAAPGKAPPQTIRQTTTILTDARIQTVIREAGASTEGRTLILTPWKHRADSLAKRLNAPALHADLADGAAWKAIQAFTEKDASILIATRIGAWLAACADRVIIDEPENDDFKQDELTPRFDARWIAQTATKIRGSEQINVGTTPFIAAGPFESIPDINPTLTLEQWQKGQRTGLPGVSGAAQTRLEEAIEDKRHVVILHPIRGQRSRIACRDCGWQLICPFCSFPLTDEGSKARCHRCGRDAGIPDTCASCGGADLGASRPGKERLAALCAQQYGDKVQVADLPDWHRLSLPPNSLVILTDLSLIGGYAEDIRRRERLVISWRRLAASVAQASGELYVLGPESVLTEARAWLSPDGLAAVWQKEWTERTAFRYPPAGSRIKLLVDGDPTTSEELVSRFKMALGDAWGVEGPYPVAFRSKTRQARAVIHVLPPVAADENVVFSALEPFVKEAIIDLDPIAFFS